MFHRLVASAVLLGVATIASAANMAPTTTAGPVAGEKVPPLESIVDESTRNNCRQHMTVN